MRPRRAAAALLLVLALAGCRLDRDDWGKVTAGLRARYPGVPTISTDELAAWRARPDTVQPLLLDTRTRAEFAVSHLPGARHAPDERRALALLEGARIDTPVVLYCSIGYRSAGVAEDLRDAGWTGAVNLEGSIFTWANEGRPLRRDGEPVAVVHPYSRTWAGLLDPGRRAPRAVIEAAEGR